MMRFTEFFSVTTQPSVRRGVILLLALFLVNLLIGGITLLYGMSHHGIVGLTLLAWGFGLRHAMDADHISAIDNATRRLLYRGKPSVGVGCFFSLGHSTVVILLTLGIMFFASSHPVNLETFHATGNAVGAVISSLFLFVIGGLNVATLFSLHSAWKKISRGEKFAYHGHLHIGGPIEKLFRPLIKLVDTSYKMYGVGFLFGLGLDTTIEVGTLSLFALSLGLHPLMIVLLPLAFTFGMALLDTLNGLLMLGIYSWGGIDEKGRLLYNISITGISAFSALAIGAIISARFLTERFALKEGLLASLGNIPLDIVGYALVTLFLGSWVATYWGIRMRNAREKLAE